MGRLEGSLEESLGQSAALGNFSEPDQSWTHFGNVPVAATSSAHDGLVLLTLDQKASVGMHVVAKLANRAVVQLVVVGEDGPARERREVHVFGGVGALGARRDVGSSCGSCGLHRRLGAMLELRGVQADQVIRPGDSLTVPALLGHGIVAPVQQVARTGADWLRAGHPQLAAEGASTLPCGDIELTWGYYSSVLRHLAGSHTSVEKQLVGSVSPGGGHRGNTVVVGV